MSSSSDDIMDLLVAYALDALEPEEMARVSNLLNHQPELRRTVAELRATANKLPHALELAEPPPDLRQRVLDRATGRATRDDATAIRAGGWARRWLFAFGSLATLAILLAVMGWAQLADVRTALRETQAALATIQSQQREIAETLVRSEVVVDLRGDGGAGKILRSDEGSALLAAQLPPLADGRVYQFWLIRGQNSPVSGGTFTVDQDGRGLLALAPNDQLPAADTFAVTNEPAPGSSGPTTPILIAGRLPSS